MSGDETGAGRGGKATLPLWMSETAREQLLQTGEQSSAASSSDALSGRAGGLMSTATSSNKSLSAQKNGVVDGHSTAGPQQLTGFDWFRSLGSPRKIVAPMVDQSELAYRQLTRKYGADLVYTQMFNSNVFARDETYRRENFQSCAGDRPLIVQFCGNDPETLLAAAKMVENDCDAVDINLGCPQGIARRGRYGAFLMEELDLLRTLVSTLAKGLKIPVTCKTRIYKDFDRSLKLCETLVDAGASLLTIHGRTREEKGQHVKEADWETIRKLKAHFSTRQGKRVPIVANGGIECFDDIQRCITFTGVDAVMSSEAILENPGLFSGQPSNQIDLTNEYLEECRKHLVPHYRTVRSHLQKMLFRYCTKHTDIRDRINVARTLPEFQEIVDSCSLLLRESEKASVNYDMETWYARHRNPTLMHSGRVASSALNTARGGLIYQGQDQTSEDDGIGLGDIFGRF